MKKAQIFYFSLQDEQTREEKLKWFANTKFADIPFEHIQPDQKGDWIDIGGGFGHFLAIIDDKVKSGKSQQAVFELFSRGVETGRDEWVFDFDIDNLHRKIQFFLEIYTRGVRDSIYDFSIKWNSSLKTHADNKISIAYQAGLIIESVYRPYTKSYFYSDKYLNHRLTQNHYEMYGYDPALRAKNITIAVTNHTQIPFSVQVVDCIPEVAVGGRTGQCLPLYRYEKDGTRIDNITDWGLTQFQTHYNDPNITKQNIFHYTYAVLHHPAYRTKYELNLKREFPRLPFYDNFAQWVTWGEQLMELHIGYETVEAFGLVRKDEKDEEAKIPKAKLKADKANGVIILDDITRLEGIPAIAWDYKLGNRSALEWILDQYKEKKPKDPTIAAKFNTYRFADYKEQVIDLLDRVCTVSVETMKIIQQMPEA